jgi:hypothetical protein
MKQFYAAVLVLAAGFLACGSPSPRTLNLYPTATFTPTLPHPTVTQEATMVSRTDVPACIGTVVTDVLETRVGPGESYSRWEYRYLYRGETVTILGTIPDGDSEWVQIGEDRYAAAVWHGKVYIERGCK